MLHQKIELHSDLSAEEAAAVFRSEMTHHGFHGTEQGGEFRVDHRGNGINAFRPDIRLSILPEEEGCLLWADMRLPPVMLGFMLLWTVLPVALGIVRQTYLLMALVPLFWVIAVIAFRMGVRSAKEALMAMLGAYEVLD